MKKISLLFAMLMMMVSGAWADGTLTLTFSGRTGTKISDEKINVTANPSAISGKTISSTLESVTSGWTSDRSLSSDLGQSTTSTVDLGQTYDGGAKNPTATFKVSGLNGTTVKSIKFYYKFINAGGGNVYHTTSGIDFKFTCAKGTSSSSLTDISTVDWSTTGAEQEFSTEFTISNPSAETADDMYFSFKAGRGTTNTAGCFVTITKIEISYSAPASTVTYKYVDASGKSLADDVTETAGTTYTRTLPESISSTCELTSMNLTSQTGDDVTFATSATFTANTTVYVTCQEIIAHTWSWTAYNSDSKMVNLSNLYDGNLSTQAQLQRNSESGDYYQIAFDKAINLKGMKSYSSETNNSHFGEWWTIQVSKDGNEYTALTTTFADQKINNLTFSDEAAKNIKYVRIAANKTGHWNYINEVIPVYEIAEVTATMNITDAGWATFCAPFQISELPEGVKAYTGTMSDDKTWVKLTEQTLPIAAGTPLVVAGPTCSKDYTAVPAVTKCVSGTCLTGNLIGAVADVDENANNYLLQKQNDIVGWYLVASDGLKIGKNRCYMTISSTGARAFYGMGTETTGINSIAATAAKMSDGKYLVNGRIIAVKAGKAYNMNGTQVK